MKPRLRKLGLYLLDRLDEKSSWVAIIGVSGTLLGRSLFSPEYADAIALIGSNVTAAVLFLVKEG